MVFCDGRVKGGFEEGLNFGFNMWDDCGNNPWRKLEACAQENVFDLGVKGGYGNVILKFSL